jgi:hypothetical protein
MWRLHKPKRENNQMFEEMPFQIVLVIGYAAILVGTIVAAILLKDLKQ